MVDMFSHYIELAPLEDQTAESILNEFKKAWIYNGHGVPRILLTDQGPNPQDEAIYGDVVQPE